MTKAAAILSLLASSIAAPQASVASDFDSRVARVSYVSGDVSYQRGDDDGWAGARINTPLVTGDSFYAPEGGRAEVDLGSGVIIRVDGGTEVELVNNSTDVAQLGLNGGVLDLSARSFPSGFTLELDTPTGAATILEPGRYRFEVSDRGTAYTVVQGSLSLAVDGEQLDVREGESLVLEHTDPPRYGYGELPERTSFDAWADDRDRRWEHSASQRYVNDEVVGYEDLDEHGSWRDSREYGRVWTPSGIPAGWAPYREGRWIWQDPYGWTWVSYEPWGWAPYHYGRWVYVGSDWCWVPPPPRGYRGPAYVMNIEPMYAPALVAFVGGRNWSASVSVGDPAIGWVPLAPRERYYYPWQPAPRVTNNAYTNITVNNAVTVVNYNTFGTSQARPVTVDRAQVARAPVLGSTPVGVVPQRASLVVSTDRRPQPPATRVGRPLVARLVPPPKPQQFTQKVAQIERTGRPVPQPIASGASVGKPFSPGSRAPADVKPFTAPPTSGRAALQPRAGAPEVRAPKKIERDIAPPVAVAQRGRRERAPSPGAAPPPARTEGQASPPERPPSPGQPGRHDQPEVKREDPAKPEVQPTPPRPESPGQSDRRDQPPGQQKHQAPPVPPPKSASPPPEKPDPSSSVTGTQPEPPKQDDKSAGTAKKPPKKSRKSKKDETPPPPPPPPSE